VEKSDDEENCKINMRRKSLKRQRRKKRTGRL